MFSNIFNSEVIYLFLLYMIYIQVYLICQVELI